MHSTTEPHEGLLVLDGAYSLGSIRRRRAEHTVLCRDLRGYFSHVWSVHPIVGADPVDAPNGFGGVTVTELSPIHTFVEGHIGIARLPRFFAPLNFALAQAVVVTWLIRLAWSGRIGAIRAGDPYYLGLLALLLGRVGRVPVVIRINGNYDAIFARTGEPAFPRLFRSRRVEKVVERFVLRHANFVTAGNANNLDFARANGADPDRSAVVRYGNLVDPQHFLGPGDRPAAPADAPATPFCICVSRLEPVKRVGDALQAFALVHGARPDLRLVFIGDGSLRGELELEAEGLGIAEAVEFAGERDQRWLAAVLPGAELVIAPSAGRALVEAALSGRPVVAYDDDWHGELIHDGDTGRLVPVGDVDALARAMLDVVADARHATELGLRAREAAMVMMDPATLDAAERKVYETLSQ
jgi:glycosyltransferase involved in cell wall biosynthesis